MNSDLEQQSLSSLSQEVPNNSSPNAPDRIYPVLLAITFIVIIIVGGYYFGVVNRKTPDINKQERSKASNISNTSTMLIYSKIQYSSAGHPLQSEIISYNVDTKEHKNILTDTTGNKSFNSVDWFEGNKKILVSIGNLSSASGSGSIFDNPTFITIDFSRGTVNDLLNLPLEIIQADDTTSLTNNDIYYVLQKENTIQIGKYDKISHDLKVLYTMTKSQIPGLSDWRNLAFSFDKTKLLYDTFGMGIPANIYLLDLQKGVTTQLTKGFIDTSVQWINDKRVIFQRRDDQGQDSIWTLIVDSNESHKILGRTEGVDASNAYNYRLIPGKNAIIFNSNKEADNSNLSVIDLDTNSITSVLQLSQNTYKSVGNAEISLNNRYIAFTANFGGIYLYDSSHKSISIICQSTDVDRCGNFQMSGYGGRTF